MASADGKHGAMPYTVFEDLVRDGAAKPVSFHYEKQGAQMGLPGDVTTVMFGDPEDGLWWNVRKSEIPEEDVFQHIVKQPKPYEKMREDGLITRVRGRRMMKSSGQVMKQLQHLGWRTVLTSMISKGVLRETPTLRAWLGHSLADQARHIEKVENYKLGAPLVSSGTSEEPLFMLGSAWKG